ncbi:MAG: DEAD/DEAH box helicase [Bacteroidales bacterium]
MKFESYHIHEGIKTALGKAGYRRPTDIQFKSIPPILKGEDVLAIAQTGTGKTAAYAIPVLHLLQEGKIKGRPDGVKCLVMVPTHELATQTAGVFRDLGKHTRVTTLAIHGGVDQEPQIQGLAKGVDVLVATPGRMFDLVHQGALSLDRIEVLVLDEADHMLDLGFIKDIRDLVKRLPQERQTLFFSATIDEQIKKIAYSLVREAIRIQIAPKDPVARNIDHGVAFVEMDHKRFFLEQLVRSGPRKRSWFSRTCKGGAVKMPWSGWASVRKPCTGTRPRPSATASDRFRKELKLLIATDLSARRSRHPRRGTGGELRSARNPDNYIHRVGRGLDGRKRGGGTVALQPGRGSRPEGHRSPPGQGRGPGRHRSGDLRAHPGHHGGEQGGRLAIAAG